MHGNAQAHGFKGEARVIAVHVRETGACREHHFTVMPPGNILSFFQRAFRSSGARASTILLGWSYFSAEVHLHVVAQPECDIVIAS